MTQPPAEPPVPPAPVLSVSRFEERLINILRFFLRQLPPEKALGLVDSRSARPPCLSAACLHLVRDSLAKGCVQRLARGGWRREPFLRHGLAVDGRLWERTRPAELALAFSKNTVEFLLWVTAETPRNTSAAWQPREAELTPADRLLLYFAYDALRGETETGAALRQWTVFVRNALVRLAFPEDFAAAGARFPDPDFAPWLDGLGACILEALQAEFVGRWYSVESAKGQVSDWARLRALGQAQEQLLEAFSRAVFEAGRPDLARFLLTMSSELLAVERQPTFWIGGLQGAPPPRLADQIETRRSALALLRQMNRFQEWERWARSVGPFDDGYRVAQLWLTDWEQYHGPARAHQAQALLRQVEPLRRPAPGGTTA